VPINGMNTHGETPLFHAIMHSNLAVFDALIERKASFNLANKCVLSSTTMMDARCVRSELAKPPRM
jgi:ankyrin repeat protein